MKFINRNKELNFLETKWASGKPQLTVVYGKRRVGKTELIKQFIKGKPAVYFLADKRTIFEQLRELSRLMGNYFQDSLLLKRGFEDWLDVFQYLKEHAREQFVFVVDEYPYLVEVDKAISSVFQKGWDEHLKNSQIFLVLLGSSVSMMESEALLYKSPLYGRRTGQILLKPLPFRDSWKFFSRKTFDEFLSIFSVTGGIPAYLLQIDPDLSFKENLRIKVFPTTEFLHNEIEFVLKEELREPKNYLSILRAISWGKRKFGEIVNETGLQKSALTKYLNTLERLQLIEKEVPVTEKNLQKSRKGLYQICDNFFRFWFQYIFPYKSDFEIESYDEVWRKFKESFPMLEAATYEKVSRETMWDLRENLFNFERVGNWWEKDKEIDVVALNKTTREIIFGEAKWSNRPVGINVFRDLTEKASSVQWNRGEREEYYILFSKSGFTGEMCDLAKSKGVFLVHKGDLL